MFEKRCIALTIKTITFSSKTCNGNRHNFLPENHVSHGKGMILCSYNADSPLTPESVPSPLFG